MANDYEKSRMEYLINEFVRHIPMQSNLSGKTKREFKHLIRDIADDNSDFENLVFELGCNKLAKELVKKYAKDISD